MPGACIKLHVPRAKMDQKVHILSIVSNGFKSLFFALIFLWWSLIYMFVAAIRPSQFLQHPTHATHHLTYFFRALIPPSCCLSIYKYRRILTCFTQNDMRLLPKLHIYPPLKVELFYILFLSYWKLYQF